ncbi:Ldh family oxidoreductase [Streptomyces sp. NPDC002073]
MARAHVEADLRGITGHGSRLAPNYLSKIRSGLLNPRPKITVLGDSPACRALDGDMAPGPVAARHAVGAAVVRARRSGAAVATVRNTGHAGALGVYVTWAARHGLIALLAAQTSAASVALHGGTGQPVLGNTALAIAVPGTDPQEPVLLDMAAGAMSWGGVHRRAATGRPLPPGSALDAKGRPVLDPAGAAALLPAGERGQALAIVLELLVGSLTASNPLPVGSEGRGLLCLAVDPRRFGVAAHLAAGVEAVAAQVRAEGARMPGDRAWASRTRFKTTGIGLDEDDMQALIAAGEGHAAVPAAWATPHLIRTPVPAGKDTRS